MTEPIYPWPITILDSVHNLGIGMRIPIQTKTQSDHCENCRDPDGLVYVWKVVKKGPMHLFTDQYGNERSLPARINSAPCPVCRPATKTPEGKEDKIVDEIPQEELPWWDK